MSDTNLRGSDEELEYLFSPEAIRAAAARVVERARKGETHFVLSEANLPSIADFVKETIEENYPSLNIPFHSRWSHFQVGKIDRLKTLDEALSGLSVEERLCAKLDLAVVSVLLDAGSGPQWKYREGAREFARSEGLAVASFHMFMNGAFSGSQKNPYRVDANALEGLTAEALTDGFQVNTASNPLVGFEGRLALLRNLGKTLKAEAEVFGESEPRPGNLFRYLQRRAGAGKAVKARSILRALQKGLGSIWPGRVSVNGVNMGDVWVYPPFGSGVNGLVPFHKLSQWLTYSLIEPMLDAGIDVVGVSELTGLAEYRNGGLLVDMGLLTLKDPAQASIAHRPDSELVVEWRALTIFFLDKIAELVRKQLGKSEEEFPLARVLEGGTWWAGRKIASELRQGGVPPLRIESDGTVF